jgi:exodeoxyribonuclease V alpha subunit
LPLDVLVVDEASMIDLEMMANLLDALPPNARLVCWATRTSWPRWRPARCWATCAAMPRTATAADPGLAGADGRPIAGQQRPEAGRTPAQPAGPASGDAAHSRVSAKAAASASWPGWSTASRPRGPRTAGQPDDVFCLASSGEQTSASTACCSTASTAAPKARRAIAATCATSAACARHHRHRQRIPLGAVGRRGAEPFEDFQLLCAVRKGAWGVEGLNQRVGGCCTMRADRQPAAVVRGAPGAGDPQRLRPGPDER